MSQQRDASPGLFVDCCLEIDVMVCSVLPGFVFMMFGSEEARAICYWIRTINRCFIQREIGVQRPVKGGVMVNKWCKT